MMHLPYVIDNRDHRLIDVLDALLHGDKVQALDIATAYFNVGAFELIREGLEGLASFRLLLGAEPGKRAGSGAAPTHQPRPGSRPFDAATLALVEALIRYLRRDTVAVRLFQNGFLHAKAYLAFADTHPFDRFTPVAGIVGSRNFTRAGLTHQPGAQPDPQGRRNAAEVYDEKRPKLPSLPCWPRSLWLHVLRWPQNLSALTRTHRQRTSRSVTRPSLEVGARAILELLDWYDARWAEAADFRQELVSLLDASKFGGHGTRPTRSISRRSMPISAMSSPVRGCLSPARVRPWSSRTFRRMLSSARVASWSATTVC